MQDLTPRLQAIKQRIAAAANKAGRNPADITLIGVTKTVDAGVINEAITAGLQHIGENRVQEFRLKSDLLQTGITRHMIGHLQRNKVKYAVKLFDIIQSIDSITLAEELNARCAKLNRQMPILIEVNTSGEDQKFGCSPAGALTVLKAIDRLPNLTVRGFMTVAIYSDDIEQVRPCFRVLREIYEQAALLPLVHAGIDSLSMGMSSDFEAAIEEGATHVRIGSALFGERNQD